MAEGELRRFGLGGDGPPDLSPLPAEQRDGRGANGTRLSVPRSPFHVPRYAQPPPRYLSRQTQGVEPQRVEILDPRGEDFGFPRSRRDFEAVEEIEHRREPFRPLGARAFRDPLPPQQEPREVRRGDGLDLLAQPIERVAVNARQQAALAPLEVLTARGETSPQDKPLVLEPAQGEIDIARLEAERSGQLGHRRGPDHLEPSSHQFADRVFAGPRLGTLPLGDGHLGLERGAGVDRREHRHPLGRDPQTHRPAHHRRPPVAPQLF